MSIIEVKNIGKKYNISHRQGGYLTLRDVLTNIFSNPFKFLKQKAKAATGLAKTEEFWALKDVSFNVEKGEVIGIIGHNGAGKSTLLKILSQITPPTTGEIKINGRVGSLLEVGTGFHPELTGRENIFLNGAILGMERAQIVKKFDEIVEFSGVEKFLDTPVKYYSSGMYVRLAFSVAAHMEPDVLIIDEVLAVGDADFQKKCLGKMDEITKTEGRTILFVSHNMSAIKQLCKRSVLLEKGEIKMIGDTNEVIKDYLDNNSIIDQSKVVIESDPNKDISFTKVWITDAEGNLTNNIEVDQDFYICVDFDVNRSVDNVEISVCLKNSLGNNIIFSSISDSFNRKLISFEKGRYSARTFFKGNFLMPDIYSVLLTAHIIVTKVVDIQEDVIRLVITENGSSTMAHYGKGGILWSSVISDAKWDFKKNE